jgi:uncharacterized protein
MKSATSNPFGFSERDEQTIRDILRKYPDVKTVYLFGSRAKGTSDPGSDVDLAIMNEDLDRKTIGRIKSEFEESSLPYRVDIVNYPELTHKELKDHIDQIGVPFFRSSS